jgi:ABC-type transporter Mla subunit MlaD
MATFTYRLENGDPLPDDVADAIQARLARLQDLLEATERVTGAIAVRDDKHALDQAQLAVVQAVAAYREADARLEQLAAEANRGGSWRTVDLRDPVDKPVE